MGLEGSSPGEDELVGLVSYGSEDGNVGVYARISHLYDWIVANMCEMNPAGAPEEIDCGNVDTNLGGGNEITSAPSGDSTDSSSTQVPSSFSSISSSFEFDDDAQFDDDNLKSTRRQKNNLRLESQYASSS